ncbi:alpha-lytic protease prodomain-containing protein [Streptomyces somaliensis]|uniref:alpha-lytic protease prodomain-containing protein n=1 Tax=Streptomyces somaliensis TaxID=78355 RepID=UPI0020CCDC1D|nr:alpha-lytic protease prodomain-containing protein [Streptomyces somaliensis]MCP9943572.1 alpha-lytic protease prodomain-containing protein [Streptomyces somaliensis]
MFHRHAAAAWAATAAAVGALVPAVLPGAAAAAPVPPAAAPPSAAVSMGADQPSPGVLAAMQRDLGLTAAQAQRRLVNEAEAGAAAGRLGDALGADYAGAWVRGAESATLTVATTDPADAPVIRQAGAEAVVVRHSLAALDAAKDALDRAAARADTVDVPVWYVDVRTNSVTLRAVRRAAAEPFLKAAGVDRSLVRVEGSAERPRPVYDIRGGDAYYTSGGGRCSVGFAVTRGTRHGFATAGHCGRPGTVTIGFNGVPQGAFQGSVFPGRDMAWVAVNADWRATPYVRGADDQDVRVTGSTQAVVGASICRSGSTTGWHCGTIQQHGTSVTYPEGTVSGLTRTSVCAEPGDSGGSFLSGSQAQGVTSGGSGDCRTGGTTYHQPINPILRTYGLTLTTTADPGGAESDVPPGEPGGTWTAGTVYDAGDQVAYGGATYRCLQPHQARVGWEPPNAPALWQRA